MPKNYLTGNRVLCDLAAYSVVGEAGSKIVTPRSLFCVAPVSLFYGYLVVTLLVLLLSCPSVVQQIGPGQPGLLLDISYWPDPVVLNVLSLLLAGCVVTRYIRHQWPGSRHTHVMFLPVVLALGMLLVGSYVLSQVVLKPAFFRDQEIHGAGETFFLGWFVNAFGPSGSLRLSHVGRAIGHFFGWAGPTDLPYHSAAPAGFVFRQTLLLLISLTWSFRQGTAEEWRLDGKARSASVAIAVLTIIVTFVCLYRGLNTPFAVGMGVACGYFFFLASYHITCSYTIGKNRQLTEAVMATLLILGPLFCFYSNSAREWVTIILVMLSLVAIPELIPPRRSRGGE